MRHDFADFVTDVSKCSSSNEWLLKRDIENTNHKLKNIVDKINSINSEILRLCDKRKILENQRDTILRTIGFAGEK